MSKDNGRDWNLGGKRMKEDQVPNCWVQMEDGEWICYVMENKDPEFLDIEENWKHVGFDAEILEVIETCRICGQCDVHYPL
tara:strand:+ start:334 stop:576 length:243 start_codon:yes stop_codon:yes gene_type:complete